MKKAKKRCFDMTTEELEAIVERIIERELTESDVYKVDKLKTAIVDKLKYLVSGDDELLDTQIS